MNERLVQLVKEAGFEPHIETDGTLSYADQFEKFAKLVIRDVFAKVSFEGSDFYYNPSNNYGIVTAKLFTGKGDPWTLFRGEKVMTDYYDGVRWSGYHRVNDDFVNLLYNRVTKDNGELED